MLGDFHQIYHEHISIYPFMLNLPLFVTVYLMYVSGHDTLIPVPSRSLPIVYFLGTIAFCA
jgi:hypothetical protein